MNNPQSRTMVQELLLEDSSTAQEKLLLLNSLDNDARERALLYLLETVPRLRAALKIAEHNIKKSRETVEKLTKPPLFPAIFLRQVETPDGRRAEVRIAGARRVVEVAPGIELGQLAKGDEVYLAHEANVVLALAGGATPLAGEIAQVVRWVDQERILLKWRDEELIVDAGAATKSPPVSPGDAVCFSRESLLALKKVETSNGESFLLEEVPDLDTSMVGGQEDNLGKMLSTLQAALLDPAAAKLFGVTGRNTIALFGPPGCGKTLLARVTTSHIAKLTGRRARFVVVKPGQLESSWVGETQRNIRALFELVNRAARDALVVVFFDELESLGRIRGTGIGHHDDKALTAILAEINGFKDRENVAIIAASNRPDLVDPALLERCSDVRLEVKRPDLAGARAIFNIHLPAALPFSPNGTQSADTRREVVETAVSLLYAPNADNELCRIRFRDGKERVVSAREMVSGRFIEQVCKQARLQALLRHLDKGVTGIMVADIRHSVAQAVDRLRATLTPVNARAYLGDLPQDVDVIAVEPITRKLKTAHRYYFAHSTTEE